MTTIIVYRPYYPTLLLSPDGSRDRNGVVTPTVSAGITVVPGKYGQAWRAGTITSRVTVPASVLNHPELTILIRFKFRGTGGASYPAAAGNTSTGFIGILNNPASSSEMLALRTVDVGGGGSHFLSFPQATVLPYDGQYIAVAARATATTRQLNAVGDSVSSAVGYLGREFGSGDVFGFGHWSQAIGAEVESLLVYDTALTDDEIQRISTMDEAWTWDGVGQQALRPQDVDATPPNRISGNYALVDEVFITDRNNERRDPLGNALIDVQPDWDIDRAGSKGQVSIEAHQGVLKPGMWIAPYRTIIPEVGEIIRYQRGHFKLGRPGITYDGTFAMDTGEPAEHQQAYGADIIDDIAARKLSETFYTPLNGHVLQDVYVLLKMATCGIMGPNLLAPHNPGFESDGAGWTTAFDSGAAGSFSYLPAAPIQAPEGAHVLRMFFNSDAPTNSYAYARGANVSIPPGTQCMYFSGLSYRGKVEHSPYIRVNFVDASGNIMSGVSAESPRNAHHAAWHRHFIVAPVPQGAVSVQLLLMTLITNGPVVGGSVSYWDDIRLGTCTMMPIPDTRINLPPSTATATTRIQTTVGKSIGYDAINGDRIAAIGHQAVYTDLSGGITTSPLRDLEQATPFRTFREGDYRFVGVVEVPPGDGNIPNHFVAVKASFEEGVPPLFAEAYNKNPYDEFSVINSGGVFTAPDINVPDVVDQAALQAVADAARDRHSTQEALRFTILTDLELTVYHVIAIDDPTKPKVNGTWLIESIHDDGPLMVIGARRAIGGGQ